MELIADLVEEEMGLDHLLLNFANLAAVVIMDMEEGLGYDDLTVCHWVKVTVDVVEYRQMEDPCFAKHFRMSRRVFQLLQETIGNHLVNVGRWKRTRTSLIDILLMVIWVLATPDSFRSIALTFGVHPSTLYYHYAYIIEALRELASTYIQWPDETERTEISDTFRRATGMPGVVGCIDCTHVYVTAPIDQPQRYVNRHHSYSLTTQAVVHHKLVVRDLLVGEAGSLHDSRTFRRSPLSKLLLEDHNHQVLRPEEHLVGDGAYTLTNFMMIPYDNNGHRTHLELSFNKILSQSRVRVENAFGRLKGKWRRLKFLHAMNQRAIVDHITACFVVRNFTVQHDDPQFDEEDLGHPLQDYEVGAIDVVNEHVADDPPPLLENAQRVGEEKRQFITNHIVPQLLE